MNTVSHILSDNYPSTPERIEGQLVYLEKYGVNKLDTSVINHVMKLDFHKARFFTGYRKFTIIDVVIGICDENLFLLTNPVFSDRDSNLIEEFEKINANQINAALIAEIIILYQTTGANITPIDIPHNKYQIWFGDKKWRTMKFHMHKTLKIETIPNASLPKKQWLKWF